MTAATRLGRDGEVLRVLNFSGGGFDTVMQLGVTHALLVNGGRAPDVVVGISAGTIQAAALADVMRVAPLPDPRSKTFRLDYRQMLGRRVARFREFADACHRAPQELVDSLLPDAYQIDSFEPLSPLESPRMIKEERDERLKWIQRRSGLVRLYNDLLSVHVPIGTIARLIRRILGLMAASAIGRPDTVGVVKRWVVRVVEAMKAWLVIGDNLTRLVRVARIIVKPVLKYGRSVQPRSAGSIIFRFGIATRPRAWLGVALSYLFLVNLWVGMSVLVLVTPIWVALTPYESPIRYLAPLALLVYAPIVFPLFKSARAIDRQENSWQAARDLARGAYVFVFLLIKWFLVLTAIALVPVGIVYLWPQDSSVISAALEERARVQAIAREAILLPLALAILGIVGSAALWLARSLVRNLQKPKDSKGASGVGRWLDVIASTALGLLLIYATMKLLLVVLGELRLLDRLAGADPNSPEFLVIAVLTLLALATALALAIAMVTVILGFTAYTCRADKDASFLRWYARQFLDYYELGPSLGHYYGLKRFLVRCFDPDYYGKTNIGAVAEAALADDDMPKKYDSQKPPRRTIGDFERPVEGLRNITLGIAAAEVKSGQLDVLKADACLVDALLAATAITPFLETQCVDGKKYIDAANLGDVPTSALMQLLRSRQVADISALHIYAVDPLPVSKDTLSPPVGPDGEPKSTPYLNLIETAVRALQLQRFRDARIERRLTKVFTDVFPDDSGPVSTGESRKLKTFYKAYVAPIELERPIRLNSKILTSTREDRRAALAETIAMGCRASLQVMLAKTLAQEDYENAAGDPGQKFVSCSRALLLHQRKTREDLIGKLPGSGPGGPGLQEICKNCCITDQQGKILTDPGSGTEARMCLRLPPPGPDQVRVLHDWPHELVADSTASPAHSALTAEPEEAIDSRVGPDKTRPEHAPAKACLFGGGVFRGVFQMGVLNALSIAEFKPTLVAGASVGAITAAMVRSALDQPEPERSRAIARMAMANIAVDRIVLTDRFSDFIRNWTIRASEARFSIKQADFVFRKYDSGGSRSFQRNLRAVVAGLERLFYINPYQLNEIVAAARNRDFSTLGNLLSLRVQGWLNQMNVGDEILGAEPLRQMIEDFVIPASAKGRGELTVINGAYTDIHLLATTTNLTQGGLHILGTRHALQKNEAAASLPEALLASSAFPAVFRPRKSWDLMPGDREEDEYVDGGIMDNLPLEPVLRELRAHAHPSVGLLDIRPEAGPHLVVAASLEPDPEDFEGKELGELPRYWPELNRRAGELKYNTKLNLYESATRNVQALFDAIPAGSSKRPPLDTKVIAIKPLWLCNTFAFHPMLGFRRVNQAKSIAHGCAATLIAFSKLREHHDVWDLDKEAIPKVSDFAAARSLRGGLDDDGAAIEAGKCWLQEGKPCPFSAAQLETAGLEKDSVYWLSEIHRQCWDANTHTRDALNSDGFLARLKHRFLAGMQGQDMHDRHV
jgi:predicted acylesterase/phospholipase RssA